ncbi:hypothetical protein BUALT_Bualt02G0113500 [Buddleja alternifolia]|uniref:RanBD1 domain-containing protein n=1 Tax=Buddleja alternifolia TaxID=168488 RepID=A0AAV6Y7Z0_9LAMI|nr:hypothetical protein BUALT_Bualt02G0113500 [Buddleja alternifolia]
MADTENNSQSSKKRAAGVQLSRDNPGLEDDEETSEQETGTFKRASDEVLATRKIVKVRRNQISSTPSAPGLPVSNPFAAIQLVPPDFASPVEVKTSSVTSKETEQIDENGSKSENEPQCESTEEEDKNDVNNDNAKVDESKVENSEKDWVTKSVVGDVAEGEISEGRDKKATDANDNENEARKDVEDKRNDEEKGNDEEKNVETASFSSFQQLSSSQNAFSGLTGTGFSSTSFSFGSIRKDSTTGSLFGPKSDQPSFGFSVSSNGNSSPFGNSGANTLSKSEGDKFPSMQEVPVETGEENEKPVFTADSALFEFIDGKWKERGKGELKINIPTTGTGKARLIMRAQGNYRLILNASLFPDMKLTNMEKKGITFACVNNAGEGKDGLSTIALKFKDSSIVEDFRAAVTKHKEANMGISLKTPENSP